MHAPLAPDPPASPRMLLWVIVSAALILAALWAQEISPGSVVAVTLYKAHLLALGGWGGYWLDRALFPYDRPHEYLQPEPAVEPGDLHEALPPADGAELVTGVLQVTTNAFGMAMLRRAIVVAASLVCVGLGA